MSISLYDATVARYLQTLGATEQVLQKGAEWCAETEIQPAQLVEARLRDDMFPLRFQIVSVAHHSLGAIRGVESGEFGPPAPSDLDYAGLQGLLSETRSGLESLDRDFVEGLAERELTFRTQKFSVDFVGSGFLLSFSMPNFYFHATTAYDILRAQGVQIGKLDFLGQLSIKT